MVMLAADAQIYWMLSRYSLLNSSYRASDFRSDSLSRFFRLDIYGELLVRSLVAKLTRDDDDRKEMLTKNPTKQQPAQTTNHPTN